jgi:hypothetical protein
MLFIKVHELENNTIVAMCDEVLINKVIEDDDVFIDINTYSAFYKDELVEESKALEIIYKLNINSANVIGKESINVALKANLIKKENIRFVNKIPYAQSFLIKS